MHTATNTSARTAPGWSNGVSWNEMLTHRAYLVRFAQRKLRDPSRL